MFDVTTDPRGRIFLDPSIYARPAEWQATAAELRRDAPVLRVESEFFQPFWALTRHAEVFDVSRRNDVFHNTRNSILAPEFQIQVMQMAGLEMPKSLVHMDGTEHRDHRQVANDWFKPAAVRHRQDAIDAIADTFIDKMLDMGGECDFAQDVAVPYTLRVIMSIYGVPPEDEPLMLELTQGLFGAADPEYLGEFSDPMELVQSSLAKFEDYFDGITDDRRRTPRDDLATVIAQGQVDGCPMGDLERFWYYIIVATAGHDTTSFALSGGVQALLDNPDQTAKLVGHPELAANATEEIIRWTAPVRHFMRYAQEDTVVGGVDIPAGDRVLLSYWSANRDESVFENADRFDIEREDVSNLISFGLGAHYCLGSQFARREVRTFLDRMATRLATLELAGEAQWSESAFVGGVKHLPVSYTPA